MKHKCFGKVVKLFPDSEKRGTSDIGGKCIIGFGETDASASLDTASWHPLSKTNVVNNRESVGAE